MRPELSIAARIIAVVLINCSGRTSRMVLCLQRAAAIRRPAF